MPTQRQVAKWKIEEVERLKELILSYPIVGIVDMHAIPAKQLQKMRELLRGEVLIKMSKKRLMKLALEKASKEKNSGLNNLIDYLEGQPAFIFTKMNPFKLYKILEKNKTSAPPKPNSIAPKDIVVPKGETPFSPGPILAELQKFGISTSIQKNKVVIREDKVVAKKGEKISPELASLLTRLGIEPMEIGLKLLAAYEEGVIYTPDILAIDEEEIKAKINKAYLNAINLSVNIGYLTKETVPLILLRAYNEARTLGIEADIFERGVIKDIITKAHLQMLAIKSTINWEVK